jgi:hypothetical protein
VEAQPDAIYLAMVDRFENGAEDLHPVDSADGQGWHGGDLKGALAHLDRLQAMGIHTLWLTPLTASRQAPFHEWGAYHGYWPTDLKALEPRFGDWGDLARLKEGLEARGMSLMLDMVYNHVEFDHALRESHPHWFHEAAPITDWTDPVQVLEGQVHGLPDLAQEEPEVSAHLIEASLLWLEKSGAKSIRVDAVRHIGVDFIRALDGAIDEQFGNEVELVGEIFEGDAARLASLWAETGVDRVFDFPLYYALIDTLCGESKVGRLASVLSLDRLYGDPQGLITFLDNHDLPRLASQCDGDQAEEALLLLAGLRGSPSVTWGTEVMSAGETEPDNRWVTGLTPDGGEDLPLVGEALRLRARSPALREGLTQILYLDETLLLFLRIHGQYAALVGYAADAHEAVLLPEWMHSWTPAWSTGQFGLTEDHFLLPGAGTGMVFFAPGQEIAERHSVVAAEQARPPMRDIILHSPDGARIAGAGPELGHWDPSKAPPLEEGSIHFAFPVNQVLSFKRFWQVDGELTWEDGENRSVLVEQGDDPLELDP